MDYMQQMQQLRMTLEQETRNAILHENALQGARQRVSETQGRLNMLQEIMNEEQKTPIEPKAEPKKK